MLATRHWVSYRLSVNVQIAVGYTGGELLGDLGQRYPWKGVKP